MTISGSQFSDSGVMFILNGDGVDDEDPNQSKFAINAFTGELFLISSIDRDPPNGREKWKLNITAEDDKGVKLEGCAEIVITVKDINDNVPFFPTDTYLGNITENSVEGIQILTLKAEDVDEDNLIKYSIEMNRLNSNGQLIFDIDELSGVLSSAVCCLDRESIDQFVIKVCATDGFAKTCVKVIVIVIDQNDELPKFVTKLVPILMNTNQIYSGKQISNLSVSDNDLLITNRFVYQVLNHSNYAKYFSVKTNGDGTGLLYVKQKFSLDQQLFSTESNSYEFSLTVAVSDCGHFNDISRIDYCEVSFKVQNTNYNNNQNQNLLNRNSETKEIIDSFISFKNGQNLTDFDNKTIQQIISNGYNSQQNNNNSNHYFDKFPFSLIHELTLFYLILAIVITLIIVLIVLGLFIKIRHKCNLSTKLSTNNSRNESVNESDHDLRDGIRSYNFEGGGECDISLYDLRQLQIPINLIDSSYATNLNKCDAMQKVLLLPDVCNKSPNSTTRIPHQNNDSEAVNIFVVQ